MSMSTSISASPFNKGDTRRCVAGQTRSCLWRLIEEQVNVFSIAARPMDKWSHKGLIDSENTGHG